MIDLPAITLLCADTANHALACRSLGRTRSAARFARSVFLTQAVPLEVDVPSGIDVARISKLGSRQDYSALLLKGLEAHVATSHVLVTQWDGYVLDPVAWTDDFLAFDYIGAPWLWHDGPMRVGNGGFSLRSRRLIEALRDPRISSAGPEDEAICRTYRPILERDYGIRFADEATAARFAFESEYPTGREFGFHGLFNFHRVVPPAELRTLPALFSDAIALSPQCDQLMHNCLLAQMWAQGAAVARRILAADPGNDEVRAILADVEPRIDPANLDRPCVPPTAEEHSRRGDAYAARGDAVAASREYRAAEARRQLPK